MVSLQKIFHNRSTKNEEFCAIHSECLYQPLPFYATKIINSFLLQGSQLIAIKDWDFSQSGNLYNP